MNSSLVPRRFEVQENNAWYLLFAHAQAAVEFHRRRLSSYTFVARDEYSSVFFVVREALLLAVCCCSCIIVSSIKGLAQEQKYN